MLSIQVQAPIIAALEHDSVGVRAAACSCIKSLSRSVQVTVPAWLFDRLKLCLNLFFGLATTKHCILIWCQTKSFFFPYFNANIYAVLYQSKIFLQAICFFFNFFHVIERCLDWRVGKWSKRNVTANSLTWRLKLIAYSQPMCLIVIWTSFVSRACCSCTSHCEVVFARLLNKQRRCHTLLWGPLHLFLHVVQNVWSDSWIL